MTLKSMLRKFVSPSQKDIFLTYLHIKKYPRSQLVWQARKGPPRCSKGGLDQRQVFCCPLATYIIEIQDRLAEMAHLIAKHSSDSQQKQKQYYDRGAKSCSFYVGEQVLILFPTMTNRLNLKWAGPYKVTRRVSSVDFKVEMPGMRHKKKT